MPSPLLVTAAIVERDGRFLLTQRLADARHNANRWEFPGGKVEFGEDPRKSLSRELREELGIAVIVGALFEVASYVYGDNHVVLLAFRCTCSGGEIRNRAVQAHAWVMPSDFRKYDITEADLPFVERLR